MENKYSGSFKPEYSVYSYKSPIRISEWDF